MAIAAERLAAMYNRPAHPLVDHFIYAIVSDGDLMKASATRRPPWPATCAWAGSLPVRRQSDRSTAARAGLHRGSRHGSRLPLACQEVADGNDLEAVDQACKPPSRIPGRR
jgi:transketolase